MTREMYHTVAVALRAAIGSILEMDVDAIVLDGEVVTLDELYAARLELVRDYGARG